MPFTRREFVLLATSALLPRWLPRNIPAPISITLVHSGNLPDLVAGARMSAGEAQRAAQLLRRTLEVTVAPAADFKPGTATGLILATDSQLDLPLDIPIIDATGSMPRRCAANIYHLTPSPAMLAAAPRAQVWHHSLYRFGAGQLNDRFRAAGIEPNSAAWAGWFAVKCLWESQLRGNTLADSTFDGHKGRALAFSAARTLLQPLYLIEPDRVLDEWAPPDDFEDSPCIAS